MTISTAILGSIRLMSCCAWIFLISLYIHLSSSISVEEILNDTRIIETYDLNNMKGIMKRQNLKVSKLRNPNNEWHSCYQVMDIEASYTQVIIHAN